MAYVLYKQKHQHFSVFSDHSVDVSFLSKIMLQSGFVNFFFFLLECKLHMLFCEIFFFLLKQLKIRVVQVFGERSSDC